MSEQSGRIKQSFVAGSLTSSAGVFLAKAIGLFYVIPFTALAGESNMIFYSAPYTYYNVLLQICSAGLPYAIAAIIAKYASRDDYKTVMLVRKLSTGILSVSGFLMAVIFFLISRPLAGLVLGEGGSPADIATLRTSFVILSIALFLVPILYSYRGFYQGLKELKVYASSQVLEQIARVAALLGLGFIAVRVLRMNNIWAVYMAILATSIGAAAAILYYIAFDRRHIGPISRKARAQSFPAAKRGDILKELFAFGLPYLFAAILGNSQTLVNTNFFVSTMTRLGMEQANAQLILGIMEVQCDKLTSIPQVLGAGFSVGIVPYMTVALENRNWKELRKNVRSCLETVLYIGVPVCFCMSVLSRPVYYVMYGNANLDYGANALSYAALLALVTTLTPICSSMMMTLHLRKESIFYLLIGFVVKCATFYPLLRYVGYPGAILSSVLCSSTIIYLSLAKIKNRFEVEYGPTILRFFKMFLACMAMNGFFAVLNLAGFTFSETSRLLALCQLAGVGAVGILIYLIVSSAMKVPQAVFHKSVPALFRSLLKRGR
ncbi:MAG: polysaccharide biosynthesis protein [Solobacterium sp.]|nr:polysaccharide biosynthesis protein [Erysipelotrichaceae bacterium]MBQ9153781.1 polysaccharide biosynthesis protein [Solobacterium sp.]